MRRLKGVTIVRLCQIWARSGASLPKRIKSLVSKKNKQI